MIARARRALGRSIWRAPTVALVALLFVEGGVLAVIAAGPPLRVGVVARSAGPGLDATFTLHLGTSGLNVRASLLAGTLGHRARDPTVIALVDDRFPFGYGNPTDALSDSSWVGLYLSDLGAPAQPLIKVSDSSGLPLLLADHPEATLLMFNSGVIPDALLSAQADGLRAWLQAGGTLVWAGGPIGYSEGHPGPAGSFVTTNLGWRGQIDLLGFNLTNPAPVGTPPALNVTASPLATALGLAYDYPGYGANVSELVGHGGVSIGFETVPTAGRSSSIETSIAYLPVGQGKLLYFGSGTGAVGIGQLPRASESLSQDTALLLSLGFAPGPGTPVTSSLRIGPLGSATVGLTIDNRSSGVVALAVSRISGSLLYAWSEQLAGASERAKRSRRPGALRSAGTGPADRDAGEGLAPARLTR